MASNTTKICRGCLSTTYLRPLFDDILDQQFRNSTGLALSLDDGLSASVCVECVALLNVHHSFRLRCIETEEILRHRYQALQDSLAFENIDIRPASEAKTTCATENKTEKNENVEESPTLQQYNGDTAETKIILSNLEPSSAKRDYDEAIYESDDGVFDEEIESNISLEETMEKKTTKTDKLKKSEKISKKLSKEYDPYEHLILKPYYLSEY